jgi:hypothetical protein
LPCDLLHPRAIFAERTGLSQPASNHVDAELRHRDGGNGTAEVSVRVEGDAGRFYALAAPLLGLAVRRSITRDLRNLKQILESRPRPRR